jgi:hypothetical protein
MAAVTALKTTKALRRIAAGLRDYAKLQGLRADEFQILFRVLEDWGKISVLLILRDFGGLPEKQVWLRVWEFLEAFLRQGNDIGFSVGLLVRDGKRLEQGGTYSVPEGYVEEELLLNPAASE